MKRLLTVLWVACFCSGCALLREDSADLKQRYARAEELLLRLDLDREERVLTVTLQYTGDQEVHEDYLRPGFRLFCVGSEKEVRVLDSYCDSTGLYSIPEVSPGATVSYRLPLEQFAFLQPDLHISDCLIFIEYRSKHGTVCSNALRIEEPLSLGAVRDGNAYVYRAMEVTTEANKPMQPDAPASRR
jgi:hypothetical protein